MLWNANELAKISGDFEKNNLFMTKRTKIFSISWSYYASSRSLTLPAGAIYYSISMWELTSLPLPSGWIRTRDLSAPLFPHNFLYNFKYFRLEILNLNFSYSGVMQSSLASFSIGRLSSDTTAYRHALELSKVSRWLINEKNIF